MTFKPWGKHDEAEKQVICHTSFVYSAREKLEEFVTESTIDGVKEMLRAYPQLKVGKFDPFPCDDAELHIWLEEL